MNFLFLTNKMPYPPKDGGSIASFSLARHLKESGNNISFLAMNTSKHNIDVNTIPKDVLNNYNINIVNVNTDIKVSSALKNFVFSKLPYNAERFISEEYNQKLISILENNKFDIVHLEGLYLCPYIETIRKYSDAKIALRSHNIEHEIWERTCVNERNSIKRLYLKSLAKRIKQFKLKYLNKYDFLIPITKKDEDRYFELGNTRPSKVVQTGVDSGDYCPDIENSEFPGFFHIGALDWMPNQEGLVWFMENVWSRFIKIDEFKDIKFYVAGRNASEAINKYLNSKKNVVNLGEVDNAIDFMNSKSIMIVPLLSGSGMRIKIIEGMALGKCIISTKVGIEGINAKHGENVIIADTEDEFLSEMKNILTNKNIYTDITRNAVNFVLENYDNKIIVNELVSFYQKNL